MEIKGKNQEAFKFLLLNLKVETEERRPWIQQCLSVARMLHVRETGQEDPEVLRTANLIEMVRNRLSKRTCLKNKIK